jgi:hypothetical protein
MKQPKKPDWIDEGSSPISLPMSRAFATTTTITPGFRGVFGARD